MSHEADQARQALGELDGLTAHTRRASRSMATGLPMAAWGAAWIVGLAGVDLLTGPWRVIVPVVSWLAAMALSWSHVGAQFRTGTETRMRWAWLAILLASPFIVTAAGPSSFVHGVLLLGALWGLAMSLYAVATRDRPLLVTAVIGIVLAGVLPVVAPPSVLLCFGIGAGVPLLALGISRVATGGRGA